jgi:hypothetical protein
MVYGSVGKLGESHVINVQLLNVATGQIESSAREKFGEIDEAYDVVHRLVVQLAQTPGTPGERQAGAGGAARRFFIDVAGGFVLASDEQGIEVGAGARYVYEWRLPIGVGVGVLLGLGFAPTGLRFGLDGYLYAKPFPRLAFSVGFRGLPIYIGFSGGLTLGVHFDKLFVRAYVPVIYDYGFGLDAGYTF